MECYVNNSKFDHNCLIYRDQGFGTDPGILTWSYKLFISDSELAAMLNESFSSFVAQCEEDDKNSDIIDIPEIQQLKYPSLATMITQHKSTLAKLLKDFLYFHLLDAITKNNLRDNWRFSINDIAKVELVDDGFLIEGTGYNI